LGVGGCFVVLEVGSRMGPISCVTQGERVQLKFCGNRKQQGLKRPLGVRADVDCEGKKYLRQSVGKGWRGGGREEGGGEGFKQIHNRYAGVQGIGKARRFQKNEVGKRVCAEGMGDLGRRINWLRRWPGFSHSSFSQVGKKEAEDKKPKRKRIGSRGRELFLGYHEQRTETLQLKDHVKTGKIRIE